MKAKKDRLWRAYSPPNGIARDYDWPIKAQLSWGRPLKRGRKEKGKKDGKKWEE